MPTHAMTDNPNGAPPQCLLWSAVGCEPPLELLRGLGRRNVPVREVHDAPSIMLALAGAEPKARGRVLVILEPDLLDEVEALVDAVRRYHRPITIWGYRADADPPLQPWPPAAAPAVDKSKAGPTDADAAAPSDHAAHPESTADEQSRPAAPAGQSDKAEASNPAPHEPAAEFGAGLTTDQPPGPEALAEGDMSAAGPHDHASQPHDDDPNGPLLTEDELAMLLDEHWPDDSHERADA